MVRQPAMHGLTVLRHGPVAGDAAQSCLPGMDVAVDQAGDHDHFGGIDDLRVGRLNRRADRCNVVILHQHVAAKIARLPVHGNNRAILDENM